MKQHIPRPTVSEGFLADLRSFDPLLMLVWSADEDREQGVFAHWIVMREVPAAERPWVVKRGIIQRQEQAEVVTHWVDGKSRFVPHDAALEGEDGVARPLFEMLAAHNPMRWGGNRFEAWKRMCAARNARQEKERRDREELAIAEGTEETLREASKPERFATVTVDGFKGE